jgi:hypothetical protein
MLELLWTISARCPDVRPVTGATVHAIALRLRHEVDPYTFGSIAQLHHDMTITGIDVPVIPFHWYVGRSSG